MHPAFSFRIIVFKHAVVKKKEGEGVAWIDLAKR
jgi:hypothetical protein